MQITSVFCEHAETRDDGRLDIRGVTTELQAPGFPARHARIVLVGMLQWPHRTHGRQAFRIDVTGPDDTSVFTIDGHTDVDARDASQPPARTQLVLPLENVVFPEPGRYCARIATGDTEAVGATLHVVDSASDKAIDNG